MFYIIYINFLNNLGFKNPKSTRSKLNFGNEDLTEYFKRKLMEIYNRGMNLQNKQESINDNRTLENEKYTL